MEKCYNGKTAYKFGNQAVTLQVHRGDILQKIVLINPVFAFIGIIPDDIGLQS